MTSRFHILGHMALGVGNIRVNAVLQQVVITVQRIRQGAPRCMFEFVVVANCAPGAKSAIYRH